MNRTYSTLEMLALLKENQVAISSSDHTVRVRKNSNGFVFVKNDDTTIETILGDDGMVILGNYALELKWTIKNVPNFVPVHEAIKAYMDGKTIASFADKSIIYSKYNKVFNDSGYNNIELREIKEYYWAILD